jgi:hypothetical protein
VTLTLSFNQLFIVHCRDGVLLEWIVKRSLKRSLKRFITSDIIVNLELVLSFLSLLTVVGLERGALSLVSTTEELLDRKVAAPVYKTENTAVEIRHDDHVAPSIRKSWQSLRRQAAVARTQTMEFFFFFMKLTSANVLRHLYLVCYEF